MRKILSLCLAVVLVLGTAQPSGSYAMSADPEGEFVFEEQAEPDQRAEVQGDSGSAANEQESPAAEPETGIPTDLSGIGEQESDKADSDQGAAVPANVLISDNTAQIEEQEKQGQEPAPQMWLTLTGEKDFPEGARAQISVWNEEELDGIRQSLAAYLEEAGLELVDMPLPLEINVLDAGGAKMENPGRVSVKISMEDAQSLKELSLYHQTQDGTWKELSYDFQKAADTELSSVTFATDSFSPFVFAQTKEHALGEKAEEPAEKQTEEVQAKEEVKPIIIEEYNVSFVDGASKRDGKYVWNPTDPAAGHMFVYRLDYTVSGTYSKGAGALRFELPLHILKDRNGNWADDFECPYISRDELTEDQIPDFVYEIDEENNKVIISNYKEIPAGEAGYMEFAYAASKTTLDYVDMAPSAKVETKIYATGENGTVTKEAAADEVYIDTHVKISSTQKRRPDYYTEWQPSWGEKPADAENYYYLVWTVRTNVAKNTSPYHFSLSDTFTDLGGSVVGYRFSGQSGYSPDSTIQNQRNYGDRYDYVLTRHSKAEAEKLLKENKKYEVKNQVEATVDPVDQVDEDTTASASCSWWYETPRYIRPTGHFWAEKWGVYGNHNWVRDSEDISSYALQEFLDGDIASIDDLCYYAYLEGYPYPWTLEDGAAGTEEDARNGKYGKKKVSYTFTDDRICLEGEENPLADEDYDMTGMEWTPTMRTAVFDENTLSFQETNLTEYQAEDAVTIWVRAGSEWKKAAVYDMQTKEYRDVDGSCITSASGNRVQFAAGIKGVRFTCENAYYYTKISMYPAISLKRTDHVLSLIGQDKTKIRLTNEADTSVAQEGTEIFNKMPSGTDYIQKVVRDSEIKKDIIQTRNDKYRKQFTVTWRVNAREVYTDDQGLHYIPQNSGAFFDLAPAGAGIDLASVKVNASGKELTEGSYTVSEEENFRGSGRTLLRIHIKEATQTRYQLTYCTVHTYNSIQDYGKNLLNSAAYETGNDKIAEGYPDNGGKITEKDLLSDLDADTDAEKFLYAEARYHINILMSANTGLIKQVKSTKDAQYTYHSTVNQSGNYTYQIRLANDAVTEAKDIIFFDSLENFYQLETETAPTIPSDWKGTMTGIDVSNLTAKDISPVIYLSKVDAMNIHSHHDLTEMAEGEPVWMEYSAFVETYGLEQARAIAVDARKKADQSDFVLGARQSLVFTVYMKAPEEDATGKTDPVTYNNIYVKRTAIRGSGEDVTETYQFYHQDYTSLHYRVTGGVALKKVDETDMETPVQGAAYLLRGTSDYGTAYSLSRVSDRTGLFSYEDIEKGTYELLETSCGDDWLLDTEVYTLTIDGKGNASLTGLTKDGEGRYLVGDKPRIHADLSFQKSDSITENPVNGAEFLLTGTSGYGTDVFMRASAEGTGTGKGTVSFSNLELGTYELTEITAPEGYIQSRTVWTVKVDERGVAALYDGDAEAGKNTGGEYVIQNEPYHAVRFVKSSSYGENIFLGGAKFSLNGISDYGTNVSAAAASNGEGLVVFDGLEPGTYQLKETKAPDDHELNENLYTVTVKADGTFTIDGLATVTIGGAELYNFKDVRTTGTVCLTKVWKDKKTNKDRPVPDMSISTEIPSRDPRGYTITYDANGGSFAGGAKTNSLVYSTEGTQLAGTYGEPAVIPEDAQEFKGWYTAPDGGQEYLLDEKHDPETALTGDITVYARYTPMTKYAVAIYGIGVDILEEGIAGLTFGPALGENYIKSWKSHMPSGVSKDGHAHRCVHDDDWATIVEWNQADPYVYEQCIAEGCTHSVALNPAATDTIYNKDFDPSGETGDGPSMLYYELMPTSENYENLRWHPNGGAYGTNKDGWGASRIRAMLNGADPLTDIGTENYSSYADTDVNKSAAIYTESNCLFAAFPDILRQNIGAKEVRYDPVYNRKTEENLKISHDRLWLFSPNELAPGSCITKSWMNHPLETGSLIQNDGYEKYRSNAIDLYHDDQKRVGYCVNDYTGNAAGSALGGWLRSSDGYHSDSVLSLGFGGIVGSSYARSIRGVAPGFTLKR